MSPKHFQEEQIRGQNILHFLKKHTGVIETEICVDALSLEDFFCGECLYGFPFWEELENRRENGYLIQESSDVYRMFSEIIWAEEDANAAKCPSKKEEWMQRGNEATGLFLKLCCFKAFFPSEFYAALLSCFVCYEMEYRILAEEPGQIACMADELREDQMIYGFSEENGDLWQRDQLAVLEIALECRQKGIEILPADINLSEPYEFRVEEAGIRIPFNFPYCELNHFDVERICEKRKEKPFTRQKELETFLTEEAVEYLKKSHVLTGITEVFTGIEELDRTLGGFLPGKLYFVAGRPGIGTTTFLHKLAESVVKSQGVPVGFYSYGKQEWDSKEEMILNYEIGEDMLDLEKMIRQDRMSGFIIIDGMGYVRLSRRPLMLAAFWQEEVNRRLKLLAEDLCVPVVVTSAVSRSVEERKDRHPQMQDILGAIGGRKYADGIMALYREGYYVPNDETPMELEILKSPEGRGGLLFVENS